MGEERAWRLLSESEPGSIERNALSRFDPDRGCYMVESLGMGFDLFPETKAIVAQDVRGAGVQKRLSYFLNLSLLWYLVGAKDIGTTGRLVRPEKLKGGHHFFTGTHELPLAGLAAEYGSDKDGFLGRAAQLKGEPAGHGDASAVLYPAPRVPITLILWLGDDEFPARADLLFDSSVQHQAPLDIAWSMAMLTVLAMMPEA